ncbi:hypothetical protein [Microvirga antarctica]|uniref:hypothetical protein n=1 Tax=Microvirga antarctica TaxID=2819233 RepID=UPI001B313BE5|nr:hypothetical protein [Microvirga antarctica]
MVEIVMMFASGFLAATLIALLIIPAINQRAERLARRRAEALFPMSIAELTAEKDHLRAEFAVRQRRIEQKAEAAEAVKFNSMEELGRRAMAIESLDSALAERNATLLRTEAELADTRTALSACEGSLSETKAALADRQDTLSALESTHSGVVEELATMRRDRDQLQASLAVTASELTRTSHSLAEREEAYAQIDAALTAALSEIDSRRIAISDLETRLMTQKARGDDFERALGDRHSELSDERKRLAGLAKNLTAEQERGLILEQHIRELEADRDAKALETSGLLASIEANEARLSEHVSGSVAVAPAENEELRLRIKDLANKIMSTAKAEPAGAVAPPPETPQKSSRKNTGKRRR